jgi:hypothetical protein
MFEKMKGIGSLIFKQLQLNSCLCLFSKVNMFYCGKQLLSENGFVKTGRGNADMSLENFRIEI